MNILGPRAKVVICGCGSGLKYLSTDLFSAPWATSVHVVVMRPVRVTRAVELLEGLVRQCLRRWAVGM